MANFTIRNTSPAGLYLPYYMTTGSGGLNTSIVGNGAIAGADVLNNCVGYSQGRMLEIYYQITAGATGNPFSIFNVDAENWYTVAQANGFRTGSAPQVGAVGVCSGLYQGQTIGHVFNIEQYANGRWEISESHYNYPNGNGSWDYSYLMSNGLPAFIGADSSWQMIGYIYPFDGLTPISGNISIAAKIRQTRRRQKRKVFVRNDSYIF